MAENIGFNVWNGDANVVLDGISQMLRLHASGTQAVAKGGTWTFTYTALNHEPVFIVQFDPVTEDWEAVLVKTGDNWTGVTITNRNTSLSADSTFFVWVYRRT